MSPPSIQPFIRRVLFRRLWHSGVQDVVSSGPVGVIGGGRIGLATISRLRPLVDRIALFDPYAPTAPADIKRVATLDELLGFTDILTVHLPLTDGTRGLVGSRELALLRPGSIVVNVSRGGIVDQVALCDALRSGHLAGAGLDVTDPEPPSTDDPLFDTPRLILTPHIGWYSTAAQLRALRQSLAGTIAILDGHLPADGRLAVAGRR